MRLIDADKLKKDMLLQNILGESMQKIIDRYIHIVDSQPTAFDLDNVVGQLEKEESKARLQLIEDRKTAFEFSSKCRLDAYKKSIGIVKGGGVNERNSFKGKES